MHQLIRIFIIHLSVYIHGIVGLDRHRVYYVVVALCSIVSFRNPFSRSHSIIFTDYHRFRFQGSFHSKPFHVGDSSHNKENNGPGGGKEPPFSHQNISFSRLRGMALSHEIPSTPKGRVQRSPQTAIPHTRNGSVREKIRGFSACRYGIRSLGDEQAHSANSILRIIPTQGTLVPHSEKCFDLACVNIVKSSCRLTIAHRSFYSSRLTSHEGAHPHNFENITTTR